MFQPFRDFLEQDLFKKFTLEPYPIPNGLAFNQSYRGKNPATIQSCCYQCPQFRKIRHTYIDAGETAQIFNSVLYPSYSYDLPLLGIDFLAFNSQKIIIVLDFQPLFRDPDYLKKYINPMKTIRNKYHELAQNLPMKFYDANQYFSPYLLFAKTEQYIVENRLFPAYQEYLQLYWQLLEKANSLTDNDDIQSVIKAQKDYDQYSADRDPASGLFSSYFGHEWSERFLYEFLFEHAVKVKEVAFC